MACDLKARRLDLGLSQEELGIKVGCTAQQISRYETGGMSPHPGKRLEIAEFFGVKPSDIWPVEPTKRDPAPDRRTSGEEQAT